MVLYQRSEHMANVPIGQQSKSQVKTEPDIANMYHIFLFIKRRKLRT